MSARTPVKIVLGTHTIGDFVRSAGLAPFDDAKDVGALLDAFEARGYSDPDTARDYSPYAPDSWKIRLGQAGAASRFVIHTKVHSGSPGDHEPEAP